MKVVPIERISASSEKKPSLTWMSWLARLIIAISPVSVDDGKSDVKFKFFSRATFLHLLFFYGPMLLFVLASLINGDHSQIVVESLVDTFETYNSVDSLSIFFMMLILPMSIIITVFMSSGIQSIASLALAEDLSWPKYGFLCLVGSFLIFFADVLGEYMLIFIMRIDPKYAATYGVLEPWMLDDSWTSTVTALFAVFFVILALWISFTGLFYVCLISWVEKLTLKAAVEPRFRPCAVAQHCLSLFNCLQQGMSTSFFAFFTFSQTDLLFAQIKFYFSA